MLPNDIQLAVQATRPSAGRSRQLLVPIHREQHPRYGLVEVTPDDVTRYARHFAEGIKTYHGRLPFTIDHDESRGAAGWITSVEPGPDGLWGDVEWTPSGVEAIESQQYPFISPEWLDAWTDPVTQQTYTDVFEGASLVVRPQFRDLPPAVVQHYSEDPAPTVWVVERKMPDKPAGDQPATQSADPAALATDEAVSKTFAEADVTDLRRQFAERDATIASQQARIAAMERGEQKRQFSEVAESLTFAESHRLAPASREALAEFGADLHQVSPDLARRFGELLPGLKTYQVGEHGLSGEAATTKTVEIDPDLKRFAEDNGLDSEVVKAAQEGNTTWRR